MPKYNHGPLTHRGRQQLAGRIKILSLIAKLGRPPMTKAEVKAEEAKLYANPPLEYPTEVVWTSMTEPIPTLKPEDTLP